MTRVWYGFIASFGVLLGLSACGGASLDEYAGSKPALVLEDYFTGKTKAWGLFEDRFGKVRRQFQVDIDGTWDGTLLTLVEDFVYDDGEIDQRIWRITKEPDGSYTGRADDIEGVARGFTSGRAFNWSYDIDLPVGDGTWRVHFNDWLFLHDDGVMINRAYVSKFGVEIGQVTLFFRKEDAPE